MAGYVNVLGATEEAYRQREEVIALCQLASMPKLAIRLLAERCSPDQARVRIEEERAKLGKLSHASIRYVEEENIWS